MALALWDVSPVPTRQNLPTSPPEGLSGTLQSLWPEAVPKGGDTRPGGVVWRWGKAHKGHCPLCRDSKGRSWECWGATRKAAGASMVWLEKKILQVIDQSINQSIKPLQKLGGIF